MTRVMHLGRTNAIFQSRQHGPDRLSQVSSSIRVGEAGNCHGVTVWSFDLRFQPLLLLGG
jgi:hypothetical protein